MRLFKTANALPVLLAATLLSSGCGDPAARNATAPPAPTGTIRGLVRLSGPAPAPATEKISQDQSTCGNSIDLPRIAIGKENGIKDTFVFLDGLQAPTAAAVAPASVLIDQKNCQYAPHALSVPVGTQLEITNSDSILHNVHGNIVGSDGLETLFNIAQPVKGQHGKTPALTKPGMIYLTCEAGHPWMDANVFVAESPYVAISKDDGSFVIANVPAGTYKIKMWHEGVTLKENNKTLQRYEYEEPYEMTQDVMVAANSETTVNFEMTLRPPPGNLKKK